MVTKSLKSISDSINSRASQCDAAEGKVPFFKISRVKTEFFHSQFDSRGTVQRKALDMSCPE